MLNNETGSTATVFARVAPLPSVTISSSSRRPDPSTGNMGLDYEFERAPLSADELGRLLVAMEQELEARDTTIAIFKADRARYLPLEKAHRRDRTTSSSGEDEPSTSDEARRRALASLRADDQHENRRAGAWADSWLDGALLWDEQADAVRRYVEHQQRAQLRMQTLLDDAERSGGVAALLAADSADLHDQHARLAHQQMGRLVDDNHRLSTELESAKEECVQLRGRLDELTKKDAQTQSRTRQIVLHLLAERTQLVAALQRLQQQVAPPSSSSSDRQLAEELRRELAVVRSERDTARAQLAAAVSRPSSNSRPDDGGSLVMANRSVVGSTRSTGAAGIARSGAVPTIPSSSSSSANTVRLSSSSSLPAPLIGGAVSVAVPLSSSSSHPTQPRQIATAPQQHHNTAPIGSLSIRSSAPTTTATGTVRLNHGRPAVGRAPPPQQVLVKTSLPIMGTISAAPSGSNGTPRRIAPRPLEPELAQLDAALKLIDASGRPLTAGAASSSSSSSSSSSNNNNYNNSSNGAKRSNSMPRVENGASAGEPTTTVSSGRSATQLVSTAVRTTTTTTQQTSSSNGKGGAASVGLKALTSPARRATNGLLRAFSNKSTTLQQPNSTTGQSHK